MHLDQPVALILAALITAVGGILATMLLLLFQKTKDIHVLVNDNFTKAQNALAKSVGDNAALIEQNATLTAEVVRLRTLNEQNATLTSARGTTKEAT